MCIIKTVYPFQGGAPRHPYMARQSCLPSLLGHVSCIQEELEHTTASNSNKVVTSEAICHFGPPLAVIRSLLHCFPRVAIPESCTSTCAYRTRDRCIDPSMGCGRKTIYLPVAAEHLLLDLHPPQIYQNISTRLLTYVPSFAPQGTHLQIPRQNQCRSCPNRLSNKFPL